MLKDIYFFNSEALAVRLRNNELSEDLAFYHLLIYSILFASYVTIPVIALDSNGADDSWRQPIINFLALAAVQFWGMRLIYRTNKKGDGRNFFMRWAALTLPVSIQVWIIGILMSAVYGAIMGLVAAKWATTAPSYIWEIFGVLFGVIFQLIYFKLMQRNLTIASSGAATDATIP